MSVRARARAKLSSRITTRFRERETPIIVVGFSITVRHSAGGPALPLSRTGISSELRKASDRPLLAPAARPRPAGPRRLPPLPLFSRSRSFLLVNSLTSARHFAGERALSSRVFRCSRCTQEKRVTPDEISILSFPPRPPVPFPPLHPTQPLLLLVVDAPPWKCPAVHLREPIRRAARAYPLPREGWVSRRIISRCNDTR